MVKASEALCSLEAIVARHPILAVVVCLLALGATAPLFAFSGAGTGSEGDPLTVTDVTRLQEMATSLSAHCALGADIDASDAANLLSLRYLHS